MDPETYTLLAPMFVINCILLIAAGSHVDVTITPSFLSSISFTMAGTVMFLKGLGDIAVGVILATKPQLIYESIATRALHAWTGLVCFFTTSISIC